MQYLNIGNEPIQRFTYEFENVKLDLLFRYYQTTEMWTVDVTYKDKVRNGIRLACGVDLIKGFNIPACMFVKDNTGNGIDPFLLEDFAENRCTFLILTPNETFKFNGFELEI